MTETISHPTTGVTPSRTPSVRTAAPADQASELHVVDEQIAQMDRRHERRAALKSRHAHGLSRLMEERSDLRGVHALADLVDDAVRWTA